MSVQNIDEDLFGSGGSNEGAMYQPSDRSYTRIKKTAQDIVREAYAEDLVRHLVLVMAFSLLLRAPFSHHWSYPQRSKGCC